MYRLLILLSVASYGLSLYLPIYGESTFQGVYALLLGWAVGANDWASAVSWLGNVFFIIGLILILKRKKPRPIGALICAVLALITGLAVLGAGQAFIGAESSKTIIKFSMGYGFYAWIASFVLLGIGAYLKKKSLSVKAATAEA